MSRIKNWRSIGFCDLHCKQLYDKRSTAKQVARLHRGEHKVAYPCGDYHPGMFHVGGLRQSVIAGRLSRDDVYGVVR